MRPLLAACVCAVALGSLSTEVLAFRRGPVSLTGDGVGPVLPDRPKPGAEPDAAAGQQRPARRPKPVDPMKTIRNRMVAREPVSFSEIQALADSGDDLAAYFLGKRIEEESGPGQLPTALHYYARAAYAGRAAAVRPIVRLIDAGTLDLPHPLLRDLELALMRQAEENNAIAVSALARYYLEGAPFGGKPDAAEALLRQAAAGGNADIALELALKTLSGTPTLEQQAEAVRLLELARQAEKLGTRTVAENLLRQLGQPAGTPVPDTRTAAVMVAPVPATRKAQQ